jgi:hypothetical protein
VDLGDTSRNNNYKQLQMQSNKFKLALLLALVVVVMAGFIVWRKAASPQFNSKSSAAVGEVLADEIARLLGDGGKVVLIAHARDKNVPDADGERVASFQAALGRRKSPQLAAVEWLPRPPRSQRAMLGMIGQSLTEPQLLALVDQHPEARAFVIFGGVPLLSPAVTQKITGRSLKLVVVSGYGPTLRQLLQARVVAVAVVPRFADLPPGTPAPRTAKDWFAREFEILTPETVRRAPY